MLFGIVTGTFSSIYIAGPMLLWIERKWPRVEHGRPERLAGRAAAQGRRCRRPRQRRGAAGCGARFTLHRVHRQPHSPRRSGVRRRPGRGDRARARTPGRAALVCIGESLDGGAARRRARGAPSRLRLPHRRRPSARRQPASIAPATSTGSGPRSAAAPSPSASAASTTTTTTRRASASARRSPRSSPLGARARAARSSSTPATPRTTRARWSSRQAAPGTVGVLHCYTGSHDARRSRRSIVGWYVSFSGIVTFRKWTDDALLRLVPEDRLLVESDAPYLAPVPQSRQAERAGVGRLHPRAPRRSARHRRRRPSARRTADNARRLFGLA